MLHLESRSHLGSAYGSRKFADHGIQGAGFVQELSTSLAKVQWTNHGNQKELSVQGVSWTLHSQPKSG